MARHLRSIRNAALLLTVVAPVLPASDPPPIIDMHLHAFDRAQLSRKLGSPVVDNPAAQAEYERKVLAELERFNITAVTSGTPEVVKRWMAASPKRIIPGLLLWHPNEINPDELRAAHRRGDLKVLGEVSTQYEGIAPNDPAMEPLWSLAEELDIPVAIHMGTGPPGGPAYGPFPKYRATLSNPLLLEEVLIRHPKLRVSVVHAGWPHLDEMISLLYYHPNAYAEIGVLDWHVKRPEFHFYLRRLVNAGFENRILFGTDMMLGPEKIAEAIEGVESAGFLTPEQKRKIFYHNAVRFLRLPTPPQ